MNIANEIWIIGAGGIATALAEHCKSEGVSYRLFGRPEYDFTQKEEVDKFFSTVRNLPSAIVNTIGILHDTQHKPEKSLQAFSKEWFNESIRVNTLPVMWLSQAIERLLDKDKKFVFINLSARVASISDNYLGGWYSYRASKCALNMLIKTISIEWGRSFSNTTIYGYHPGTVATNLSKPFASKVPPEKLFTPQQAAAYLFKLLKQSNTDMSGYLFDWQGKRIDF